MIIEKKPSLREQINSQRFQPHVTLCEWCDKPFVKHREWGRFCCPKHREEYHSAMNAQKRLMAKGNKKPSS